jgi:hypothetical protein
VEPVAWIDIPEAREPPRCRERLAHRVGERASMNGKADPSVTGRATDGALRPRALPQNREDDWPQCTKGLGHQNPYP